MFSDWIILKKKTNIHGENGKRDRERESACMIAYDSKFLDCLVLINWCHAVMYNFHENKWPHKIVVSKLTHFINNWNWHALHISYMM